MTDIDQRLSAGITRAYPFPMTDSLVRTKPSIFRISIYRTQLPFSDTLALARECDAVSAHLGEIFKGLPDGKRYIYFRAYSKIPGDTTQAEGYKEFKRSGIPPFVHGDPPDAAAAKP